MAVSKDDVRHIAGLARVGVPEARLDGLVTELNGILAHMDALSRVPSGGLAGAADAARAGMPLGADERGLDREARPAHHRQHLGCRQRDRPGQPRRLL